MAGIKGFESGLINSGSIMMLCPSADEICEYAKLHSCLDIGIHLTLTSEWPGQRWPPVLGNKVPSLADTEGFFFKTRKELNKKACSSDVEQEMRAQIELALEKGLKPTHFDCHMFAVMANPEFLKSYIRLGRYYGVPVLLNKGMIKTGFWYSLKPLYSKQEVLTDQLSIATPRSASEGLPAYYKNVLQTLRPGLNCLLVHPAFNDDEMKKLTAGYSAYNSDWRQDDIDFFTSDECRQIIHENNIRLITWREINDRCA
jgi:predicted glycoside hydrolase/deacetylase ChbG (UPF0249 family)